MADSSVAIACFGNQKELFATDLVSGVNTLKVIALVFGILNSGIFSADANGLYSPDLGSVGSVLEDLLNIDGSKGIFSIFWLILLGIRSSLFLPTLSFNPKCIIR